MPPPLARLRRVPSLQASSRGPARRAIRGPSGFARHPCRLTSSRNLPLGLLKGALVQVDGLAVSMCELLLSWRISIVDVLQTHFVRRRQPLGVRLSRGFAQRGARQGCRASGDGPGWPFAATRGAGPARREFGRRPNPDTGCPSSLVTFFLGTQEESDAPGRRNERLPLTPKAISAA